MHPKISQHVIFQLNVNAKTKSILANVGYDVYEIVCAFAKNGRELNKRKVWKVKINM